VDRDRHDLFNLVALVRDSRLASWLLTSAS